MNILFSKYLFHYLTLGIIAVSLALTNYAFSKEQALQIIFLDVGQGDATLIITPQGNKILVDTSARLDIGTHLSKYMSLTDRDLDMVILTHPDLDHVGGMISLIDRYEIQHIIHSGLYAGAEMYSAIAERIIQKQIPTTTAQVGQIIEIEDDIFLEIYSPYSHLESFEANDYSIVMKLVYKNNSVLLMGDATKIIEYGLVESFKEKLNANILKVGHHGSQTSTSEQFVKTVSPEYGVISAGCNNRFGHPHGNVLATLFSAQVKILDTCNDGDIIFEGNGEEWSLKK